jgi:hypothetical protein
MGGSRQLHPFELHRPAISAPINFTPRSPYEHSFTTADTLPDTKSPQAYLVHAPYNASGKLGQYTGADSYVLPEIRSTSPIGNIHEFETAGFIPDDSDTYSMSTTTDGESTLAPSSTCFDHSPGSRAGSPKLVFDFDALPLKTLDSTTGPRALQAARGHGVKAVVCGVFGPLTSIRSPVVSRAQWEVVIRSSMIAVVLAVIVTGIFVAIPI